MTHVILMFEGIYYDVMDRYETDLAITIIDLKDNDAKKNHINDNKHDYDYKGRVIDMHILQIHSHQFCQLSIE